MKNTHVFLLVFLIGGISSVFIFKTFFADESKIEVVEEVVNKDYNYYLNKIKNNKEWMIKVEENAKKLNISVDSSLSMDAFDWAKKQDKKPSKKVKDYDYYLKKISNDKEWMLLLEKEAKERKISIDSVLSETARSWGKK